MAKFTAEYMICTENCNECKERCRAWQNGYNNAKDKIVHCSECMYREYCKNSKAFKKVPPDDWFCADGRKAIVNNWKESHWRDFINDMQTDGEGK